MYNIKLILEYDGTAYAGWQRQDNALTVQQMLEEAVHKVTGEQIRITGSGRTDSGVHARGQTAHFKTLVKIPADRFSFALNALLPRDIRVLHSEEVPLIFHARYSATGKRYRYEMLIHPHSTAIGYRYLWHLRPPLNVQAMKEACTHLPGTHDFAAFQASGAAVKTTVRTIRQAALIDHPPHLTFVIEGDGFLYNMVRIIVGTLVEIGRGKRSPESIQNIIISKDRNQAGPTAPPQGLFLDAVYYD